MISLDEIERTILELESKDTSYAVCEKLAWLYICKEHLHPAPKPDSRISEQKDDSEFLKAVAGKSMNRVLAILDEHMEAVKAIYPKEYQQIMFRISEC